MAFFCPDFMSVTLKYISKFNLHTLCQHHPPSPCINSFSGQNFSLRSSNPFQYNDICKHKNRNEKWKTRSFIQYFELKCLQTVYGLRLLSPYLRIGVRRAGNHARTGTGEMDSARNLDHCPKQNREWESDSTD